MSDTQTAREGFKLRHAWKLIVILVFLIIIYASTMLGQAVTFSFVTFTLYGSILIVRKLAQLIFAIKNNQNMMTIVRLPIYNALESLDNDPLIIKRTMEEISGYMTFDDMRTLIMRNLFMSDADWKRFVLSTLPKENWLTCDLSVPIYGVPSKDIESQIESLVQMTYQFRNVYLVLNGTKRDGTRDEEAWECMVRLSNKYNADPEVYSHFETVYIAEGDKRGAMYEAFLRSIANRSDLTCNIDGDTLVDRDALLNSIRVMSHNPDWACLTGDVRLLNPNYNLLTMLTMIRYFNAFNIERSAQSLFKQMTVPSGPYFIYRTGDLARIVHRWRFQTFLPKHPKDYCTFGDDRHTGTLALIKGWKLGYLSDSIVWTEAPISTARWMMQQLRWSRSAWRETYILFDHGMRKGFGFLHWFVLGDQIYLTFFPFLVLGVIISVAVRAISTAIASGLLEGFEVALPYVITVLIVNWIFNSAYGLNIKGSLWFLLSPLYVIYWLFILTPVKFWAAFTVNESGWTARTAEGVA